VVVGDSLASAIQRVTGVQARQAVHGSSVTTFSIGGPIEALAQPRNEAELKALLRFLKAERVTWRVLGNGSNVLIDDCGVPGCVITLGRGFKETEEIETQVVRVGACASLMTVSRDLSARGLSGLEFAGGIPASFGGAVRMNAGAHGGEMAEVVQKVSWITEEGEAQTGEARELGFAYRHSGIPARVVITSAEIRLVSSDPLLCTAKRSEFLSERKARQPLSAPCAGSIFKNPEGAKSAGFLIEQSGLKGARRGGAQISLMHANWIVNPERTATAKDVKALIALCQEQVQLKFEVTLTPEIIIW